MTRIAIACAAFALSVLGAQAQGGRFDYDRGTDSRAYPLSSSTNDDAPRGSSLNTTPAGGSRNNGPLDPRTQPGTPGTYGR